LKKNHPGDRSAHSVQDANLIRQILKSGDRSAYTGLMDAYFEKVYSRMLKMTGHPDDAEDLTLEAFSKAFSKLEQYEEGLPFSSWLYRIAKNNCIDHLRKNRKDSDTLVSPYETDSGMTAHELANQLPSPEQLMINEQETRLLREIIERLNPRYREIINMHYFMELSCEEIASQLALPEGTVKVRLFRARELLYNILNRE
jgi:RNA polymerase sigma factor (sigma-70 family)